MSRNPPSNPAPAKTSSLFSSMSRYLQEVKEQVDTHAPGLIAQAKAVIDNHIIATSTTTPTTSADPEPSAPPLEDVKEAGKAEVQQESLQSSESVVAVAAPPPPTPTTTSSMASQVSLPSLKELTTSSTPCADCGGVVSIIEAILPSNRCRICAGIFCSKCIAKSAIPCPQELIHADFQPKKSTSTFSLSTVSRTSNSTSEKSTELVSMNKSISTKTAAASANSNTPVEDAGEEKTEKKRADERVYLCTKRCTPKMMHRVMELFRDEINEQFESHFNDFIIHEPCRSRCYFPFPANIPEDTTYRQALRMAQIAVVVADFTGFSLTLKAVKVMAVGSELMNVLVKGDVLPMLSPLLESLKGHGIDGPTALLRLYYLGCAHTMRSLQRAQVSKLQLYYQPQLPYPQQVDAQPSDATVGQTGVLLSRCPPAVIDYICQYISAAEWLYVACLPSPHDTMEWSTWYLGRLVRRQHWSVLMCLHDTTKLPDGLKAPAFAVLCRVKRYRVWNPVLNEWQRQVRKEALIAIRGSKSPMDWTINLQEDMQDYVYNRLLDSDAVSATEGYVHQGILNGAKAMLDGYNLRSHVLRLLSAGYEVKCVGHSLGAGVAALLAAEIRNMLVLQHLQTSQGSSTEAQKVAAVSEVVPSATALLRSQLQRVTAVVFACPGMLSPTIAKALLEDRLLVNVVQGSDPIPRFSLLTLHHLAEEIKEFSAQASEWAAEDTMDLQDYVTHLGKASELHASSNTAVRRAKLDKLRQQQQQKKDKATSKKATTTAATTIVSTSSAKAETTIPESGSSEEEHQNPDESRLSQALGDDFVDEKTAAEANASTTTTSGSTSVNQFAQAGILSLKNFVEDYLVSKPKSLKDNRAVNAQDASSIVELMEAEQQQQKEQQKQQEDQSTASTNAPTAPPKVYLETVTPSPIVHLYRENDASIGAAVLSADHVLFQRIELLPMQGLEDHDMRTYRTLLDALRHRIHLQRLLQPHTAPRHLHLQAQSKNTTASSPAYSSTSGTPSIFGTRRHIRDQFDDNYGDSVKGDTRQTLMRGVGPSLASHKALQTSPKKKKTPTTKQPRKKNAVQEEEVVSVDEALAQEIVLQGPHHRHHAQDDDKDENIGLLYFPHDVLRHVSFVAEEDDDEEEESEDEGEECAVESGACACADDTKRVVTALDAQMLQSSTDTGSSIHSSATDSASGSGTGVVIPAAPAKPPRRTPLSTPVPAAGVLTRQSSTASFVSASDHEVEREAENEAERAAVTKDNKVDSVEEDDADADGEGEVKEEEHWVPCSVCSLDVTWPYIMHSTASRALATHHCTICGHVVCTYCAPAGDVIPGDGIHSASTLPDMRLALPWLGIFAPQRVCLHCYFESSYPGFHGSRV